MSSYGYLVIGGERFPVSRVRLAHGGVQLTVVIHGPHLVICGPITVFGEDDRGLWQGSEVTIGEIAAGSTLTWQYIMYITHVFEGEGGFRV